MGGLLKGTRRILLGPRGVREIDAVCPVIVPSLGGSIITNGTMEADSDWSDYNAPATNERSNTQAHGGTYSRHIVGDPAGGAEQGCNQNVCPVDDTWYVLAGWYYRASGSYAYLLANIVPVVVGTALNTWTELLYSGLSLATSDNVRCLARKNGEAFFDDVALQPVTFSSQHVKIGTPPRRSGTYTCRPTVASGSHAGMLIAYADESNFVLAVVERAITSRVRLYKRIAGTYSQLTNGTITYGDETELTVIVDGDDFALYYDGVQEGTTQTISDASLGDELHGFNALSGNTVGRVTTTAP